MQLPTPEGLYTLSTVCQEPFRQLNSILHLLLPQLYLIARSLVRLHYYGKGHQT